MISLGAKVKWNDPAINEYPEDERQEAADRIFTVSSISENIAFITDGFTEAEVYLNELELIDEN